MRPSSFLTASVESAMRDTLADLQIRSQVQDVLTELVADVELTAHLQERVEHHLTIKSLQVRMAQHEQALAEASYVENQTREESMTMADQLVRELWSVSRELGALQDLRAQHKELLSQHDEVLANLMQTEEDLAEIRARGVRVVAERNEGSGMAETDGSELQQQPAASPTTLPKISVLEPQPLQLIQSEETASAAAPVISNTPDDASAPISNLKGQDFTDTKAVENVADESVLSGSNSQLLSETQAIDKKLPPVATPIPEPAATAVVELDVDDDNPPKLEELDTEILMNMFGFLDALDILNMAQTNITMYSRVDSLFGLGGSGPEAADDSSTIASTEITPTLKTTTVGSSDKGMHSSATMAVIPPIDTGSIGSAGPTARLSTTTDTTSSAPINNSAPSRPSLFGLFNQAAQRSIANATAGSVSASNSAPSPSRTTSLHRRNSSATDAAPMNAAMANSMASKLTDAELNAIILMTERLRQKELLAKQLTDEKEKLAAQLDGTESVKQFLVAKIRDMETAISATVENETKVAQQIASDQEVIAFLDGRVQDLERENTVLLKEKAATLEQLQKAQQNSTEKAAVMGDMLQFEREKLFENEREWKATKKLLVKEVKSCRNQIAALQAECDGVREQNEILRKTVLSASHSSPTMAKDRVYT